MNSLGMDETAVRSGIAGFAALDQRGRRAATDEKNGG
jgi:hypothetical protein